MTFLINPYVFAEAAAPDTGGPADGALTLSSIDELDPFYGLLLSGDQTVAGTDQLILTGTY